MSKENISNETFENLNDIILNKGSNRQNKKIILAVATLGIILLIVVILMNSLIVETNKLSLNKEDMNHLQADSMYQFSKQKQNLTIQIKDSIKINFKTSDKFELSTEVKMSEFVNSLKKSNSKKTIEALKIMLETP
jgi:uncharacterized membrane protein YfhO